MIILSLASHHDRTNFDCGDSSLNQFLRQQARQGAEKRVTKTFVAAEDAGASAILGYHTTLVDHLLPAQMPGKLTKGKIPTLLLARLAVANNCQRQGIGEFLLVDVLRRAVIISEQTGLYAVVLDALNDHAKRFYLHYGIKELLDDPFHLYLPIGTILDFGLTATDRD